MTTLICVYLPLQRDQNIVKTILDLISTETQGKLICEGHFYTVLNNKWDTFNTKMKLSLQTKILKKGLDEKGLLDVWRDLHPFDKCYTF